MAAVAAAALYLFGFAFVASCSLLNDTAKAMKIINIIPDDVMNITRLRNRATNRAAIVEVNKPQTLPARLNLVLVQFDV